MEKSLFIGGPLDGEFVAVRPVEIFRVAVADRPAILAADEKPAMSTIPIETVNYHREYIRLNPVGDNIGFYRIENLNFREAIERLFANYRPKKDNEKL